MSRRTHVTLRAVAIAVIVMLELVPRVRHAASASPATLAAVAP